MRYDFGSGTGDSPRTYPPVGANRDITTYTWEEVEGRVGEYAAGWRRAARALGIVDPFQTAGVTSRIVWGRRLSPTDRYTEE